MSQTTEVLDYIEKHGSITQVEAWERFQCWRLSARIEELREAGIPIVTEIKTNGKTRWAEYRLEKPLPVDQTEKRQEGEAVEGSDFASKNNTSF